MSPLPYDYADKRWLRRPALSWTAKVAILALFALACAVFA